jgi:hypothetical protein
VSGNEICCACFRIFALSCCAWSTPIRWRPLLSAAMVTQFVTHPRDSGLTTSVRTTGAPLLGWLKPSMGCRLKVADGGARQGRLLYRVAVQPRSLRLLVALVVFDLDLPLRRSFHARGQPAVSLVTAGLLVAWLQLNVSGFRLVLARGWHGHVRRMRTNGVLRSRSNSVAWCADDCGCATDL